MGSPPDLLPAAAALRVAVAGDALLDLYRDGGVRGTCREAPAPRVALEGERDAPGGAANVARSLAALGAEVRLVSAHGDDDAGTRLAAGLAAAGVDGRWVVTERGRRTVVKERIIADGRLLARLDHGDATPLAGAAARLDEALAAATEWADVLVVADYEAGLFDARARRALEGHAARVPLRVVDSARLAVWRGLQPHAVTPNADEALAMLGGGITGRASDLPRRERLQRRAAWLVRATGARTVMTTLDQEGVLVMGAAGEVAHVPVEPVAGAPGVGAGDVFTAVVALALGTGRDPVEAARVAAGAAAAAVRRGGTAVARPADIAPPDAAAGDAAAAADLRRRLSARRASGARVVLTNGCFDLLHSGHVEFLERARALGDVLVVALNDDDGVRRLKGSGRPVLTLAERRRVLGALNCVDDVVAFAGDTACTVVRELAPDVYVKGVLDPATEPPEAATARAAGAEVRLMAPLGGGSTREVLRRIAHAAPM